LFTLFGCCALLGWLPESRAEGSCLYQRVSPNTHAWYTLCQMPISKDRCEALGTRTGATNARYSEGTCPTKGLVGACAVGGQTEFFYVGSAEVAKEGCKHLKGSWRPSLQPADLTSGGQ
jgi:hypothetical protein